ncbi:MAG: single-strand DNA-binding protein [Microbacteriaceae bacterium]|jgi:single-strand DNA-binding protein|nr:single-strand DNA-binding protein [Microbacteriaceae bacterium]
MARRKSTTASAPKAKAPEPKPAETKPAENDTTLVGRLVADPVLRHTRSGLPVSTIRIAVNDGEEPTFHNVVCWRRTAEVVCQYKKKGHRVEVVGRTQDHTWQAQDGTERHGQEVIAYRVQFLPGRSEAPVAEKELV